MYGRFRVFENFVSVGMAVLLLGTVLTAQTNGALGAGSGSGRETSPQPATKTLTQVEAEIVGEGDGAAFSAYLENVLPLIRANWYRLVSKLSDSNFAGTKSGEATIGLEISSNGSLGPTRIEIASGEGTLDQLALKALGKSVPFPTLPKRVDGQNLKVRCHFYYNVDESKTGGNKVVIPVDAGEGTAFGRPLPDEGGGSPGNVLRSCSSDGGANTSNCITPPQVILSPAPVSTPAEVGQAKYDGVVTLSLVVQPNGKPDNIQVVKSLGPALDKKAMDAVNSWKFKPAMRGGKPVAVQMLVEVKFAIY